MGYKTGGQNDSLLPPHALPDGSYDVYSSYKANSLPGIVIPVFVPVYAPVERNESVMDPVDLEEYSQEECCWGVNKDSIEWSTH